jgi:hypothetical protein
MLFQHLLVICLLDVVDNLDSVGLHILPDLLQEEDAVLQLLLPLLNAFGTRPLPAVQLLQILLNAQLDRSLDLLVMPLQR